MKSIQTKIIIPILVYLVLLALIIGSSSVFNITNMSKKDSEILLDEVCNEQTMELDYQLKIVEHAVDTIYGYVSNRLESVEMLSDKKYLDEYLGTVRDISIDLANKTSCSLAVYFRLNPNLVSSGTEGFFWARKDKDGDFTQEHIVDLLAYETTDIEHVGWYYVPVQTGKAAWMLPYYNRNINKEMISYVVPFYCENQLVGVIGMDIDFEFFLGLAQDITLYKNSYSYLVNYASRELYVMSGEELETQAIGDKMSLLLNNGSKSDEPCRMEYHGKDYLLVYNTLSNNMKIVIMAPVSEINKNSSYVIKNTIFLTSIIQVSAILTLLYVTKRIVKPLKELTDVAEQYAEGNWDVKIECRTNDEVKRLADSMLTMAEKTQAYITQLNAQAMKDGLTGVNNKACYLDKVQKLKDDMDKMPVSFAVVVFDVNNLKKVNDTYGHELGDELIINACKIICRVFKHSPVFRIGGDEFVVIMQGEDYENRENLLARFERDATGTILDEEKNILISVAFGMADFPDEAENYEAAFSLADGRMYQKKAKMKGGRER